LAVLVPAVVFCGIAALPALSQESPSPSPSAVASTPAATAEGAGASPAASPVLKPGPPASYYASYGLIAIGGLTILAVLAGYLFQAPGFRRTKGASS